MARPILIFILTISSLMGFAQNKRRSLDELINKDEPAWPSIKEWIAEGKNKVEILSIDSSRAREELYKTQVTTRSPMGAIVYMTGGILVDNGWIRILGSGCKKMNRSLMDWNKGKSFKEIGDGPTFLLIADDAIGGFFILNLGALGTDIGKVYYFSPDNLEYEAMDLTYSQFIQFCFNVNLDDFYKGYRWKNWEEEVANLDGNNVYTFFPYLWAKEGKDINKNTRSAVPIEEQYGLNIEFRKKLGLDK